MGRLKVYQGIEYDSDNLVSVVNVLKNLIKGNVYESMSYRKELPIMIDKLFENLIKKDT